MNWQRGKLFPARASRALADRKPLARSEDLVIEELGGEVLVYDRTNDRAHCLSVPAARVWRACDGHTAVPVICAKLELDESAVMSALEELRDCELLDQGQLDEGTTRREFSARMAKVGAVAAAAPLIYSIVAPTPALASSQAFCLALGCNNVGCGTCHQNGCSCCGPGNAGQSSSKLCTADCSTANCNPTVVNGHCSVPVTSVSCNT